MQTFKYDFARWATDNLVNFVTEMENRTHLERNQIAMLEAARSELSTRRTVQ